MNASPHSRLSVAGLLAAVVTLRTALVGTSICLQLDLVSLAHGHPNFLVVGGATAFQGTIEVITAPVFARYADRIGTRTFLLGAPILGCAADLLMSQVTLLPVFGIPLAVLGMTSAAFVPVALSTLAADTERSPVQRVASSGMFEGFTLLGYAAGFLVGPLLFGLLGRRGFLCLSVLFVLSFILCATVVDVLPAHPVSPFRSFLRQVASTRTARLFLPPWICANAIVGMFYANFAALLRRHALTGQSLVHHFSSHAIAIIASGWVVIFVAGMALWIPLVVHWGAVRSMRRSILGAFVLAGSLLFLNHHPLRIAPDVLPLVILGVLIEAGFGPAAVTYLTAQSESFRSDRSSLMALYTVTLAAGSALGALVGGLLSRLFYFNGLIIGTAVFAAVALAFALALPVDEPAVHGGSG